GRGVGRPAGRGLPRRAGGDAPVRHAHDRIPDGLGDAGAAHALLLAISDPVRKLSSVYTKIQSGAAAADRIFSCLDRQPRIAANSQGTPLPLHAESIEFRNVCFSYEPGRPALSGVDLTCRFGETVALV